MENLKIVEYNPSYAGEVARMWRLSAEGWNGEYANKTEEEVLKQHEGCTNINTYLAVNNNEVLGYCSIRPYPFDENTLQLRILNARFDCHGKGIGKTLVKKVIERAIELGYPRVDVFTWASNKRSIPLYKKCGFLLENGEEQTHLMNFVPQVMNTEALKDYFRELDWYEDFKRQIDMEPDGRKENGFNFFEYCWEKNGTKLRVEFEQRGRGIRLIETDDYIISVIAENQNLVVGKSYRADYEIVNKSGKPLNVIIKGQDNKNIKYNFNKEINVYSKEIISGEFYVDFIDEEFDDSNTHPVVSSEILINGKKALFNLGIAPKLPARISLNIEQTEKCGNKDYTMYIDIENCLNEKASFEFALPENDDIKLKKRNLKADLSPQGKTSIAVPVKLIKPTIFNELLDIKVIPDKKESFIFKKNISELFIGRTAAFGGITENGYAIVNGEYSLILCKKGFDKNCMYVIKSGKIQNMFNETYFECPKFGLPYTEELSAKLPQDVRVYKEDEYMVLEADYFLDGFKDIKVTMFVKLLNNGIIENYFEVTNLSKNQTKRELWIKQDAVHDLSKGVIPYDNKFIKISDGVYEDMLPFEGDRLSENWMFAAGGLSTRSLWWDKDLKACFSYFPVYFEHNLGIIEGKGKRVTKPVYIAISTFKNWEELRNYALKENKQLGLPAVSNFEININNGNPFVKENFLVKIEEHKSRPFKGEITVATQSNPAHITKKDIEETTAFEGIEVSLEDSIDKDVILVKADLESKFFERKALVFKMKNADFNAQIIKEGKNIYSMDNGIIEIKACPDFSSGLYSLKYKNHEWLNSPFPNIEDSSDYTPWFGGIQTLPEEWTNNSKPVLKERVKTEFVKIMDSCGNEWQGIRSNLLIKNHNDLEGIEINEYFLMLPMVSVLCHTIEIAHNMNSFMKDKMFVTKNFFNLDNDLTKSYLVIEDEEHDFTRYKGGAEELVFFNSSVLFGGETLEDKLQFYSNLDEYDSKYCCTSDENIEFKYKHRVSLGNGEKTFLRPRFYIMTKEHISDKLLRCLNNIMF